MQENSIFNQFSTDFRNRHAMDHIRSSGPSVWMKDGEGQYTYANSNAQAIFGDVVWNAVVGKRDEDFFDTEFCYRLRMMEEEAVRRQRATKAILEHVSLNDSNPMRSFFSTVMPLFLPTDPRESCGTIHIATECTESIALLRELVDEELSLMIASTFSGSRDLSDDFDTLTPDFEYAHDLNGKMLWMSESLAKAIGVSVNDVSGLDLMDLISQKDSKRVRRARDREFADLNPSRFVTWRLKPAGHRTVPLLIRARRIMDDNPRVQGIGWFVGASTLDILQRNSRMIRGGRVAGWDREVRSNRFFVSNEWKAMLGIPASRDVLYEDFCDMLHENDKDRVLTEMAYHLAGKNSHYDSIYQIRHIDGGYRWVHAIGQKSVSVDGQPFVSGCNVDISQEMRAFASLREKDSLLRTIVDTDPAMVFLKNSKRKFIFVNKALCKFYSSTPESLVGATDKFFFQHRIDDEQIREQLEKFKRDDNTVLGSAEGKKLEYVERIIPPGKCLDEARWYKTVKVRTSLNGEPCILGISSDITELVTDRDMYELLMELSPSPMYIKDASGTYLSVNQSFVRLVGAKEKGAVLGKTAREFFSLNANDIAESDANVLAGKPEMNVTRKIQRLDGKVLSLVENKRKATIVGQSGEREHRLLGCDLDETELQVKAHNEARKTFEHAVKDVGTKFLIHAHDLVRAVQKHCSDDATLYSARSVLRAAIYISGPQNFFKEWKTNTDGPTVGRFGLLYDSVLRSRLRYHRDYASLCNKTFSFPVELEPRISEITVCQHHELLGNVLDILSINAVQHGGSTIRVLIEEDNVNLSIMVEDDGNGFPPEELNSVNSFVSGNLDTAFGHVGLRVAKQELELRGMSLEIANRNSSDGFTASAKVLMPISTTVCESSL